VAAIRRDALHKLTSRIIKVIGMEDLNVKGMVRNRHLARAVSDIGMHEFHRQITYKARPYGAQDRHGQSLVSFKQDVFLLRRHQPDAGPAEPTFRCTDCGFEAGRNRNTAVNLAGMAARSAVTACGEERSGVRRLSRVKRASVKQEGNDDAMLREAA
jgi:putative transposase